MKKQPYHTDITEDIQALGDTRKIALDEVGVSRVRVPLLMTSVELNTEANQTVQATLDLAVDLDAASRGIHMSRLLEALNEAAEPFSLSAMGQLLEDLRDRQGAVRAKADVRFTYFLSRQAPVSGKSAPQGYRCRYRGTLNKKGFTLRQQVRVPVATLCPCSKAISDYGAHNQRGYISLELFHRGHGEAPPVKVCLEELIDIAEASASAPLYPLLKRTDERHVTMQAFDNPAFVEDVARNTAVKLEKDDRFDRFKLRVENHESIHQHNAYAVIRKR